MAKKTNKWFLSVLLGTMAVAFGFWLGVLVLNWYSDMDLDIENETKTRPVSILSSQDVEPIKPPRKVETNDEKTDLDSIEVDEFELSADTLKQDSIPKKDTKSLDSSNGFEPYYLDTIASAPELGDYHFITKERDQLIATLSFGLPKKIRQQSETTLQLDSLLGSKPEEPTKEDLIIVELWRSPLNFRGYKFSNNVLVVYDMTQIDALSLYYSEGKLFLSYFDVFYQISPTAKFKPLVPTSTPLLTD